MEQIKKNKLKNMVNCPLCGGKQSHLYLQTKDYFLTGEEFELWQCSECSFVYTNPVPGPNAIFSYYNSPDYSSHTLEGKGLFGKVYSAARKVNIRSKYKMVSSFISDGNILDVGCGTGELLKYFREKGWKITGIEPVEKARTHAIQHELQVYGEEKLKELERLSFDVITMWHVLEHVYSLHERMEDLKNVLKPEGVLFIAVPMIDSYDATHYGPLWSALDVPRHLYHFSKSTLTKLLEKHALKVVQTWPMKMDAFYISLLSERYRKANMPFLNASFIGLLSNLKATRSGVFSSMVFAVKKY